MVRTLIRLRSAALANARHTRFGVVSLIVASLLGLAAAGATLLLGFTAAVGTATSIGSAAASPTTAGGADEIALVLLTWMAGRVGFAAFSGGDPAMPLDMFRLLPVSRRRLGRSLLIVGLTDPALIVIGIAFGALIAFGFRASAVAGAGPGGGPDAVTGAGIAAGIVGIIGAGLSLALVSLLSTIVAALVPSGSRRRQDIGTLLAAGIISAVVVAGTLAPAVLGLLATQQLPVVSALVRILPSGWAADAVALTSNGNPVAGSLMLLALAALCALLVAWWPHVLTERLLTAGGAGHHARARMRRRMLPATPTGAVASRELRLWIRDPTRAGYLLIAFVVGLGICIVPLISASTTILLPFAGLGTIIIAAAVAGNSYGFDGAALAIILISPRAETADVRGRQLAWFLLVGPYSILLSVAGLLIGNQTGEWPWVLALLPAVLGGGVGVFILVSLVSVQPLDDSGGPTPTWVVKAYVTIILTAVSAIPAVALLVIGATTGASWVEWMAVPVGIVTGTVCAVGLGRVARARLVGRGPEVFQTLATATARR